MDMIYRVEVMSELKFQNIRFIVGFQINALMVKHKDYTIFSLILSKVVDVQTRDDGIRVVAKHPRL